MQNYAALTQLFESKQILDMATLKLAFPSRSDISLIRDLKKLHAISNYHFAGKYHTLPAPLVLMKTACGSMKTNSFPSMGH
jgi:hypothetical protein